MRNSLLILLAVPGLAMAESGNLEMFREGALELVKGVAAGNDAYVADPHLADAEVLLAEANVEEMPDFEISESTPGVISDPMVLFNPDFCQKYRTQRYTLVPLNPLEELRAIPGAVMTFTRSIASGASAVFSFEGADEMNMVAVATKPDALQFTLLDPTTERNLQTSDEGYVATASWTQDPGTDRFSIKVENPTSESVTFVLAFE